MSVKPQYREIINFGPSSSSRHGARVVYFLLHTQEGNGTAASLAAYLNNARNGVSYHYTVRDGIVHSIVDTDRASWSVLNANPRSINLCFAGSFAAWTREQWLTRRGDIEIAAWLAVQDVKKYPYLTATVNPRPYRLGDVAGLSDHNFVSVVLRIGNHHDVGPNFPWDVFENAVKRYMSPPAPAPVVNRIDECEAKNAADPKGVKLGKRLHPGEKPCKDGVGRYAEFEHGRIYWHPRTGAHAIPNHLFETYEELGWEQKGGALGYPIAGRTILPVNDSQPVAEVQAFERGVLYRRYGHPGYFVTGLIGARWAREGYENGPLGYPTSNEYPHDGGVRQDFEHGRMDHHREAVRTLDVTVEVDR